MSTALRRSTTTYEWDIETFDPETGDILDHDFSDDRPTRTLEPGQRVVLVRDTDYDDGRRLRLWAYVGPDGTMPEYFEDAGERPTTVRVPKRFRGDAR